MGPAPSGVAGVVRIQRHNGAMNIVILDDYQDAVRKLACSQLLEPYTAKVYTNTVKGTGSWRCVSKTLKFWS